MSFVQRDIQATIQLANGTFDGISDTVTLSGLRIIVEASGYGGDAYNILNCRIFGLPLTMINQLTRVGFIRTLDPFNTISVAVGNLGSPLTTIFKGDITQAWGDFHSQPDVCLNISAMPSAAYSLQPMAASSFTGATDVSSIMQGLATAGNLAFENHGVSVQLSSPYLCGNGINQIQSCARAANISYTIDRGILKIWPKGGSIAGNIPLISPETGMVGYPVYSSQGVTVTSEFIADLMMGGQFQVQSSLTPANGTWNIWTVTHELESQVPNGAWFSQVSGFGQVRT